jgi:hypothetical protein
MHFEVPPADMSHCLRFLCYRHLYNIVNRQQSLRDLYLTIKERYFITEDRLSNSLTILGVCNEIVGAKEAAYHTQCNIWKNLRSVCSIWFFLWCNWVCLTLSYLMYNETKHDLWYLKLYCTDRVHSKMRHIITIHSQHLTLYHHVSVYDNVGLHYVYLMHCLIVKLYYTSHVLNYNCLFIRLLEIMLKLI